MAEVGESKTEIRGQTRVIWKREKMAYNHKRTKREPRRKGLRKFELVDGLSRAGVYVAPGVEHKRFESQRVEAP